MTVYGPYWTDAYEPICGPCYNVVCAQFGCQKIGRRNYVPTWSPPHQPFYPVGCICPPTSEKTCESAVCPRKNHTKEQEI